MEYERIHKPLPRQSGGFSPAKLRAVLLGLEKRRKGGEASEEEEEEEEEQEKGEVEFDMELDDRRASAAERCRDVECSTSTGGQQRSIQPRIRVSDAESGADSEGASWSFDFHRAPPPPPPQPPRLPIAPPFSRPPPSKWDDAEKWIASPASHRGGRAAAGAAKRSGLGGAVTTASASAVAAKFVVSDAAVAKDSPKWAGAAQGKRDGGGLVKAVNWAPEAKPLPDSAICLSQHDTSASARSASTFITPAPTVRSVSMRDMGTEMTPIASQEPSRTGTPMRASTPIRSPTSSRPATPPRTLPSSVSCGGDSNNKELSEKELRKKTRREIMVLGQQLGKTNIAAWASKEEEEANASKNGTLDQSAKNIAETHAAAWEETEKAKYLARFRQEEIKIEAWENHQKANTEAEMRKIEVEVETMRARAHERLMNKLAAAKHKAEEMRAAAEAKRNNQAARTAQQAEYIRRTGRVPSSYSFWNWCL